MKLIVQSDRGGVRVIDADTGEDVRGVVEAAVRHSIDDGVVASMTWRVETSLDADAPRLAVAGDDDAPRPRRAL